MGVSYRTLEKWMKRLDIKPLREQLAFDHRLRVITDEHVAIIRAAREELADTAPHRAIAPQRPLSAPQRQVQQSVSSDRLPLPEGWISANRWYEVHHINRFAVLREIERGHMPEPERGEWWQHGHSRATLVAYPPEQHEAASRYAARRWPERFVACTQCSTSSDSL